MDFFSLGELFIGNGMGLWGGENSLNTFGNMHHPNIRSQIGFAQKVELFLRIGEKTFYAQKKSPNQVLSSSIHIEVNWRVLV